MAKKEGVWLSLKRIERARKAGANRPWRAFIEARKAELPYAVLLAVMEKETGLRGTFPCRGNVFGSDPTIFIGKGCVTRKKYQAYAKLRDAGHGMQGVGNMQLTWVGFQKQADAIGGCWKPKANIRTGARILATYMREEGGNLVEVGRRYNGAVEYGHDLSAKVAKWRSVVRG